MPPARPGGRVESSLREYECHERARLRKAELPGIGATKAGTSSLPHSLKERPEILIPGDDKEPGYFCRGGDDSSIFFRVRTPEACFGMFRGVGDAKAWGEITPHYRGSPYAARNIRDEVPEARLIVSIGNRWPRPLGLGACLSAAAPRAAEASGMIASRKFGPAAATRNSPPGGDIRRGGTW